MDFVMYPETCDLPSASLVIATVATLVMLLTAVDRPGRNLAVWDCFGALRSCAAMCVWESPFV